MKRLGKNGSNARQKLITSKSADIPKNGSKKIKPHLVTRPPQNQRAKTEAPKAQNNFNLTFPGGDTAFKALLSARFCSAIWCHITDCDETFNYWEPSHYLIYGKGLQTWEYSPEFALRSYAYLLLYAMPAYFYHQLLQPNPLLLFYLVRCLMGVACALSEVYFYKSVCREFGVHVGRMTFVLLLFSAGMFVSSTAFLPSTWAMYMSSAAFAAWWQGKYSLAIFFIAISSLLGWPFAALLGVPIAFDMLVLKRRIVEFIQWSAISAITILGPMILLDSSYYGKLVIAPLNIIKYNVFSENGPDLYGKEPFTFYLINGFLNFNITWVLALLTPVTLTLSYYFIPAKESGVYSLPYYISLAPFYLWLAVFFYQPHKEERFLFPIYPMICLCGAITIDNLQKLSFRVQTMLKLVKNGRVHYLERTAFIMFSILTISSLLGVSRIVALYQNYHGPMDIQMELNRFPQSLSQEIPPNQEIDVCFGKDWYRSSSSFFLPNKNWNIRFVKSQFNGMLPAPYNNTPNEEATKVIHDYFNDRNQEDTRLYFPIEKCHFLVDLDAEPNELEPTYSNLTKYWSVVKSIPFLNARKSHQLFRAFYIPFLSEKYCSYSNFNLLRANKFKFLTV